MPLTLVDDQSIPLSIKLAAWRFRRSRADYYQFLAQLMARDVARRTLLDVFEQDAWQHGARSVRGQLAAYWARRYAGSGADLIHAWRHTMPESDLQAISLAQQAGQDALVQTFRCLSSQIRLLRDSSRDFWQTVAVAVIASVVALLCLFVLPLWSVPRLLSAFSSVPSEYFGSAIHALVRWAELVEKFWAVYSLAITCLAALIVWSIYSLTGPIRDRIDGFGIWRLYRDWQAMRFLAMTATLLQALSEPGVSLRTVLISQQGFASRWLNMHLKRMLAQLDAGGDVLASLDTGLFAQEVRWRFIDTVRVHGLAQGLGAASGEISQLFRSQLNRRATMLRWLIMSAALACVLTVGWWHLSAIDQLRQGLAMFYSVT